MIRLPGRLYPDSPPEHFPGIEKALKEPNGLLAAGGDLSTERLLYAYRRGIFPWFSESQPILWWSPDPRTVLFPHALKISRSLAKVVRQGRYKITANMAFPAVVEACAAPRKDQPGTWITPAMMSAYGRLHAIGVARSLECWSGEELVGGLYGVSIGKVFFGESMFSRAPDASKVALAQLCKMDYRLIDCQMPNAHLFSLGAVCIPRTRFAELVERWCAGEEAVFGVRSARVPG